MPEHCGILNVRKYKLREKPPFISYNSIFPKEREREQTLP